MMIKIYDTLADAAHLKPRMRDNFINFFVGVENKWIEVLQLYGDPIKKWKMTEGYRTLY